MEQKQHYEATGKVKQIFENKTKSQDKFAININLEIFEGLTPAYVQGVYFGTNPGIKQDMFITIQGKITNRKNDFLSKKTGDKVYQNELIITNIKF